MINISLRQLRAFLAVARLRSFTRAAENLHITQQGLSLMIQEVEKQFGSRLFNRTTRAVTLTAAGQHLLGVASEVVTSLEAAATSIDQLTKQTAHTLSVAVTPLVAAHLMPEACQRLQQHHPGVTVRMVDAERRQIQPLVEAGEVDVGFGMFFKATAGLHRRVIFQCDLACLLPDHGSLAQFRPRQPGARLRWRDLAALPLLGLPPDNPVQQHVDLHLASVGRADEARPTYNNIPTVLSMVEAGFGGAILPSFAMAAIDRMAVSAVLLDAPRVPVPFYQIRLKGRARAPAEAAFVAALLETLQARCSLSAPAPNDNAPDLA